MVNCIPEEIRLDLMAEHKEKALGLLFEESKTVRVWDETLPRKAE